MILITLTNDTDEFTLMTVTIMILMKIPPSHLNPCLQIYGPCWQFHLLQTVVQEMNRLGIMVDLSHTSQQTARDALAASEVTFLYLIVPWYSSSGNILIKKFKV